jgi:membrane-bound serine protease (ClpP class)
MDTILAFLIVAALIAIVVKLVRTVILKTSQNSVDGFQAKPKELAALAGQSLSTLLPARVALIDGQRVDVVTDGEFIEPETKVEVVAVEGSRVVVRSL